MQRKIDLILLLILTFITTSLRAQQTNVGNITGSVVDRTQARIAGAQVVAVNLATGVSRSTITSAEGVYSLNALQIGSYKVTVAKSGFENEVIPSISVIAGQTTTANFVLQIGSTSQNVTVKEDYAGLDTTDTTQGTTRTVEEIQNLPISLMGDNNRSAVSAVQTFSGVNFNVEQSGGQAWTIVSRSMINGLTGGSFGYEIDGVEASTGESENAEDFLAPSPEQIAEVRVTNNTDATQGFNSGITIAMVTKSGTRDFHGSLSYYNRNDALEARNFFLPAKAEDKQNEGTIAVGGPVWIPRVYNGREKTYFFFTTDIFRYRTTSTPASSTTVNTVPTALMQAGNFTQLLGNQIGTDDLGRPVYAGEIYDPSTTRTLADGTVIRDPFAYNGELNVIPPDQLSAISTFFGSHYSPPTNSGIVNNWAGPGAPTLVDKDQWSLRLDQAIGSKHRLTFSTERLFGWFASVATCPYGGFYYFGSNGYVDQVDANAARLNCADMYRYRFSYLWIPKPNLLVNFRGGVTRDPHRNVTPLYPAAANAACQAGLTGTLSCRTPTISIQNYGQIGPTNGGYILHSQRTPFTLNASWQKGKHLLTFGADYVTSPFTYGLSTYDWGNFSFSHLESSLPGTFASQTGAGIASFYLGEVDSAYVTSSINRKWNASEGALYAQDKWQLNRKLTISYGLRWELTTPNSERQNKISNFDPAAPNPGANNLPGVLTIYGNGAGRNGLIRIGSYYYKAFAPKLGVAYAFRPQTVFRVNLGISYVPYWGKYYQSTGISIPSDGFSQSKTIASLNTGVTPAFNWNSGFPYTFPTFPITDPTLDNGGPITYFNTKYNRPPLVESIGAEVEQALPGHVLLRVGYVGTLSHRTYASYNLNALPLNYLSLGSLLNANINSAQAQAAGIPIPYPGFNGTVAQALTPYPQDTTVTNLEPQIGNASYNSLQINVQRHFGSLTFLGNSTIGKCLSEADDPGYAPYAATLKAQSYELQQEAKSLCGNGASGGSGDIPKQLGLSWYWDLPVGQGKHFLGDASLPINYLVGNWQLSAMQYYQAGLPIQVTSNETIPSLGSIWPVLNPGIAVKAVGGCGSMYKDGHTAYLNRAAFSDPAPYTLGNAFVLPSVRGCGYLDEDLGANKGFPLGADSARRIYVGATFTNLFNRHQLINPVTNIDNAAFGTFSAASFPRTVQLNAKFVF